MPVQRIPWLFTLKPRTGYNLMLYNTPGANQYKWAWFAVTPVKSGVLRTFQILVHYTSGSPSMAWAIYNTVPDTLDINTLTPVLTGTIPVSGTSGIYFTLTSDANMPVTRGQPFAVKVGCTAGVYFRTNVASGGYSNPYIGLAGPSANLRLSVDDVTYIDNTGYFNWLLPTFYSVEDSSGIDEFATANTITPSAGDSFTTTRWVGDSYRLGYPVRISGVTVTAYCNPSMTFPGNLTCELRRTNPDFTPVMSEPPLATVSIPVSPYAVPGRDAQFEFLFDRDVAVRDGNFCFLIKSTYTSNFISPRYYYTGAPIVSLNGSIKRWILTTNSGSSWYVSNVRAINSCLMFTQLADDVQHPLSLSELLRR